MLTGELPIGRFAPPSKKVQIDVRLDEVVLRALEKEPERRYQQASEMKTRVETIATTPRSPVSGATGGLSASASGTGRDWRSWVMGVGVRGGRKVINWPVLIMQWPLVFAVYCVIWVLNQTRGLDAAMLLMSAVMSAFLVALLRMDPIPAVGRATTIVGFAECHWLCQCFAELTIPNPPARLPEALAEPVARRQSSKHGSRSKARPSACWWWESSIG